MLSSGANEVAPKMDNTADLIAGYRRFRSRVYSQSIYRELGDSQSPSIMIIACADSRADPALIFDAGPGQLFTMVRAFYSSKNKDLCFLKPFNYIQTLLLFCSAQCGKSRSFL